jgi:hypothetical protein
MIRFLSLCLLGTLLAGASACRKHQVASQDALAEPYIADKNSVGFGIAPLSSGNGSTLWLATYASQGRVAKFRIEIDAASAEDSKNPNGLRFKFGKGVLQAEPDSDASVLIADLEKALEAKHLPTHVQRSSSLPFTYAILGENQSQAVGGGFNEKPGGNWTAMKIFVDSGEEKDGGEVFLNFNALSRKAQFSEKDSDYGDVVLAKLATVL